MKSATKKLLRTGFILPFATMLSLSIASSSYAANDNDSTARDSKNTQVQKQQNLIDKNSKKSSSENARKTKSKDKGMHIKDEVTDTIQNQPADAIEKKSPSPSVNRQ